MSGEGGGALSARVCAPNLEWAEPLAGNYFVSTYPPFSCWSGSDAKEWRHRLARPRADADRVPLGLYVHFPFCVDRCHYCYYLSHDDRLDEMDRYLNALEEELALYARAPVVRGRDLDFVYFGGGTPSLLSTPRVERLLSGLQDVLPWDAAREVTFECAPRSVTPGKLATLRDWGVTRVSLGVQQMNDSVLRANGRVHLVADVEAAYEAIRQVGFEVVNVDLIVGLVDETDETFGASLERVIGLAPDSVTMYQLEIPLNTPLWRALRDGELATEPPSWETKRDRLLRGFDALAAAGYSRATAYAAVRDLERHRFLYQREQYHGADLLGIGTSAFSHLGGVNQQNLPALDEYLEQVEGGELPLFRLFAASAEELLVRELVLQLKLGRLERAYFAAKFGVDVGQRFGEPLRDLSARGWLLVDDETVTVTREGLARVDRFLEAFYLPEHRGIRYS
jgi:coproporphyrinogen III oxidase-like Fe-S oxidoreductase